MQTLGDILSAALDSRKQTLIEVVLHAPNGIAAPYSAYSPRNEAPSRGIINNIKALREATRMGASDTMGLTEAKAAIERIRDTGRVTLRMTPERYGYFMVNRHALRDYNWQVESSRFYQAETPPVVFTI